LVAGAGCKCWGWLALAISTVAVAHAKRPVVALVQLGFVAMISRIASRLLLLLWASAPLRAADAVSDVGEDPPPSQLLACINLSDAGALFSLRMDDGKKLRVRSSHLAVWARPRAGGDAAYAVSLRAFETSGKEYSTSTYCFPRAEAGVLTFYCPFDCDGGSLALTEKPGGGFQLRVNAGGVRLGSCDDASATLQTDESMGFRDLPQLERAACEGME
jgi:hypothetical protein